MFRVALAAALVVGLIAEPDTAKSGDKSPSGKELWELTSDKLFNGKIHSIYIKVNQAAWNQLHDDELANGCVEGTNVKWAHVRYFVLDDIVLKNVAMRVHGNTSRCIPRLQFTVDFGKTDNVYTKQGNEGWRAVQYNGADAAAIKDRNLYGLNEIKLLRSFNDSSATNDTGNGLLAREYVASWAAAQAETVAQTTLRGPPVYRIAYTKVEFQLCANDSDRACNNRFQRIYLIAEPIDKSFFKMRYDDSEPTFFSMVHGCALRGERGLTPDCLEPKYVEGKKYDIQDVGQKTYLAQLLTGPEGLKARIDAAKFPEAMAAIVNLASIMNYAAVATTVGHWDSAYGNFNNDVLYWHQSEGRWKLIIWDLDNTFDYDSRGTTTQSYSYGEVAIAPRLLFDKLFAIPQLDAMFRRHLRQYLTMLYGSNGIGPLDAKIAETRDHYIAKLNSEMASEKQNLDRAREMFDYAKDRYNSLNTQIGDH